MALTRGTLQQSNSPLYAQANLSRLNFPLVGTSGISSMQLLLTSSPRPGVLTEPGGTEIVTPYIADFSSANAGSLPGPQGTQALRPRESPAGSARWKPPAQAQPPQSAVLALKLLDSGLAAVDLQRCKSCQ